MLHGALDSYNYISNTKSQQILVLKTSNFWQLEIT